MRHVSLVVPVVLSLAAAGAASAPTSALADPDVGGPKHHGVLVGARVGGLLPTSPLTADLTGGFEVGWFLPAHGHRLGLVLALDYASPDRSGTEMDPRVEGGSYSWHLTQREVTFTPVVIYRILSVGRIVPYVGLGVRTYLLDSVDRSGDAGPTIEQTDETSTKVGVVVPGGVELDLGPGALTGELMFQFGVLDHRATGDSNTGAFSLTFGYRLFL